MTTAQDARLLLPAFTVPCPACNAHAGTYCEGLEGEALVHFPRRTALLNAAGAQVVDLLTWKQGKGRKRA